MGCVPHLAYATASKKGRGRMLDELVAATGWSHPNARRQVRCRDRAEGPAAGRAACAAAAHLRLRHAPAADPGVDARLSGVSGTKPGPLLRNSIQVRKAGDEHEQAPGFCELDLVLHCGPTSKGEFCRSLTVTDVHTGWTENRAVRNGAHRWVLEAMPLIEKRLPFPLVGIDSGNDNAHVEQKNADIVRRYAFRYRYDTAVELRLLNELYDAPRSSA